MSQPSIVKNSLYKGLLNLLNMVIPIIVTPYIYRVLSPSAMGDYDYANTIYSYFNLLGLLGIVTYGIRELSRNRDDQEYVKRTYSTLFSIGIISNFTCFLIFTTFSYFTFHDNSSMFILLTILSLNLISNFFNTEWINEAFEDFKFIAIKTAIVRLIYVACIFIFIKKSEDLWIYALIVAASNFLNYILSFFYSQKYTKFSVFSFSFKFTTIKKVLPFLFFILLLENSGMLYTYLDRIMLGVYSSHEDVAYYSVGQRIMEICRALLITITYVSLPRLSYYLGKNNKLYCESLNKLYSTIMMLCIPLAVGLCVTGENIVLLFAGSQYTEATIPLMIFSVRVVTLMIEGVTAQQVLFLHRKEKLVAVINIIFGLLNLILNFVLVKFEIFTPTMAITTTLFVEIGVVITEIIYIRSKYNINICIFSKKNFKYLIVSLLFIPVATGVKRLELNNILTLIIITLSCLIIYFYIIRFTNDNIYREITEKVKQTFKKNRYD